MVPITLPYWGTTTSGENVQVTRGEVESARRHETALFILCEIDLQQADGGEWEASGGEIYELDPWEPTDEALTPISYSYRVE
jgi:hypothetical protein